MLLCILYVFDSKKKKMNMVKYFADSCLLALINIENSQ